MTEFSKQELVSRSNVDSKTLFRSMSNSGGTKFIQTNAGRIQQEGIQGYCVIWSGSFASTRNDFLSNTVLEIPSCGDAASGSPVHSSRYCDVNLGDYLSGVVLTRTSLLRWKHLFGVKPEGFLERAHRLDLHGRTD